jgi:hypothetical protein
LAKKVVAEYEDALTVAGAAVSVLAAELELEVGAIEVIGAGEISPHRSLSIQILISPLCRCKASCAFLDSNPMDSSVDNASGDIDIYFQNYL